MTERSHLRPCGPEVSEISTKHVEDMFKQTQHFVFTIVEKEITLKQKSLKKSQTQINKICKPITNPERDRVKEKSKVVKIGDKRGVAQIAMKS